MIIYDKIKNLCDEKNIKIKNLEKEIGLGNGAIGKWKKELNKPSFESLIKVANYFNISIDYLLDKKSTTEIQFFKRFSQALNEKGLTEQDVECLSNEQLSEITDIIKNFKS